MEKPIYLDNHSTTPLDPAVFEAMQPFFIEHFGNSTSKHEYGWVASRAVDEARKQVADLLGALAKEIYFTSGATESNNIVLRGLISREKNHIITSNVEHKSILETCNDLRSKKLASITILEVDRLGKISPEQVSNALTEKTAVVSLMYGNNEIGTLSPLEQIGQIARSRNVLFHSDATQAVGHVPVEVNRLNLDLVSLSAHKFHGPKGIGALYARSQNPRVKLDAHSTGGPHEMGLRPGTLNVPAIVGLGKACQIAFENLPAESVTIAALRDELQALLERLPGTTVNGDPTQRLPHNLSITFEGVPSHSILSQVIRSIALSTGSACNSQTGEISHVLAAIGLSEQNARSTLRFGLSRFSTHDEVVRTAELIRQAVEKIRQSSSTYKGAAQTAPN